MGTVQDLLLQIRDSEEPNESIKTTLSPKNVAFTNRCSLSRCINYRWWLLVSLYIICLLVSQSGANLLGRFYFNNGGNSKWMATFVYTAGFPLVIPLLLYIYSTSPSTSDPTFTTTSTNSMYVPTVALIYLVLGLLGAGDNLMYSYGLLYLPVSTYSLLCGTQLAFNVLFSYFLNSLKFTFFIFNSIVLLTTSALILAIHTESTGTSNLSPRKYIIGVICTIGASALYSLVLSLTQICFEKVLKKGTFRDILEMQVYPAIVTTCVTVVGLFVSGEWKGLKGEMEEFKTGQVSYLMTLIWTAVLWLVFSVSCLGLIYEASALFSNVISTVGAPIVPILAVVFFHDNMDGMKIVAMVLAVCGFISYLYQLYLDDLKSPSSETTNANDPSG